MPCGSRVRPAPVEPGRLVASREPAMMDFVAARAAAASGAGSWSRRRRCRRPTGPGPATSPAPDSTVSSMRRHSICNPPQIPSTGLPARGVGGDRGGQAAIAQPGQVGDGGLAARKHDQVGVGQVGGVGDPAHQHARLACQRLDVGGVGDPGQPDRGHPQPLAAHAAAPGCRRRGARPPTASPRRPARVRRRRATRHRLGGRSWRAAAAARASSSAGSPRNLLTMKPAISAWSSGSSTATVPNR